MKIIEIIAGVIKFSLDIIVPVSAIIGGAILAEDHLWLGMCAIGTGFYWLGISYNTYKTMWRLRKHANED